MIDMKKCGVFVLFVAFCIISCAKKQDYFRTEIIDGIPVVHNLRISLERAYKDIAFAEDLTIGVEEGETDYMLYSPLKESFNSRQKFPGILRDP